MCWKNWSRPIGCPNPLSRRALGYSGSRAIASLTRFRRNKRRQSTNLKSAADESDENHRLNLELPGLDQGPEALYARSTVLDALQGALDELPPEQRDVFVEHELEGRSFKLMAETSGVPLNTLLARKRSAVLHMRRRLQAVYDDLDF
jgi:DNA-directed RNA polymerase specialized sigma24 family protein